MQAAWAKLDFRPQPRNFERIFGIELNAALGARRYEAAPTRIHRPRPTGQRGACLLTDHERKHPYDRQICVAETVREQIVIVLPEPIAEKLVRNGEIGGRLQLGPALPG